MVNRVLAIAIAFLAISAVACKGDSKSEKPTGKQPTAHTPTTDATPALTPVSDYTYFRTEQCISCHRDIVNEWRTSMHAHATRDKDPIYALLFQRARKVVGPKVEKGCPKCHNPLSGLPGKPRPSEGVSCMVCHQIAPNHPAPLASGKVMELARKTEGKPGAQGLCLSCHGERKSGKGHLVCTTGAESDHAGGQCIDCHMKKAPGTPTLGIAKTEHSTHRFPGGHVPDMVKNTLTLALTHDQKKNEIVVTVKAGDVGHGLPTGNPMRHILVRVRAFGRNNSLVWDNLASAKSPFDVKDALFMRLFSSADGKKPVPPFMAAGPSVDTRLASKETRVLRYPMPKGALRVTAQATFHLAPKKLLLAAKVSAAKLKPVVVHATSMSVKPGK